MPSPDTERTFAADETDVEVLRAEVVALRIDLASARNINDNQRKVIEQLQQEIRRLRAGAGGWGDRR